MSFVFPTPRTPATISTVVAMGVLVNAASSCARVRWLQNDNVIEGTARAITTEAGYTLASNVDIREGFLRITTGMGWEAYLPVPEVLTMIDRGEFAPQGED